jgi:hypothetical protein
LRVAAEGLKNSGEGVENGGFACTIRANEDNYFTVVHVEVEVMDIGSAVVADYQSACSQCGVHTLTG